MHNIVYYSIFTIFHFFFFPKLFLRSQNVLSNCPLLAIIVIKILELLLKKTATVLEIGHVT